MERARSSGTSKKRRFDSLGGGLIPIKRRQDAVKRRFDSLGGGLVPPRKRQLPPYVVKEAAKKNYLKNLFVGATARRRFDSLGGGYIPPHKRQLPPHPKTGVDKKAAKRNYLSVGSEAR